MLLYRFLKDLRKNGTASGTWLGTPQEDKLVQDARRRGESYAYCRNREGKPCILFEKSIFDLYQ